MNVIMVYIYNRSIVGKPKQSKVNLAFEKYEYH